MKRDHGLLLWWFGKYQFSIFMTIILVIVISISEALADGPLSKAELYTVLQNMMIEGRYGLYDEQSQEEVDETTNRLRESTMKTPPIPEFKGGVYNIVVHLKRDGKLHFKPSPINEMPFDASRLNHNVSRTQYYILISDNRGRTLFGLMGGGGWSVNGGLVDLIDQDNTTPTIVELYGFKILRWHNGFEGYYMPYYLPNEMIYEFYVVIRDKQTKQGRILKNWTFHYQDINFAPPINTTQFLSRAVEKGKISQQDMQRILENNKTETIEGFINPGGDDNHIEVIIKGLKTKFHELLKIDELYSH